MPAQRSVAGHLNWTNYFGSQQKIASLSDTNAYFQKAQDSSSDMSCPRSVCKELDFRRRRTIMTNSKKGLSVVVLTSGILASALPSAALAADADKLSAYDRAVTRKCSILGFKENP
jgi:hypothetical protein